ncbi:sugar kinase [Streptococcus merionis]|uniref:sugar kinase n=1 Tax=Streptococcus merionis TaxID=400065 RepID=UPI0026EFBC27|nr:sugar kinase [Streptococcus merionis]
MGRIVALGEMMMRLSTPSGMRLSNSNHFQVHYGGGEANVAISLAHYGHRVALASKVPNSLLGQGVENQLRLNGVETDLLLKGGDRLGCYYVESGIGERGPMVIYDRAFSSFASMDTIEWDVDQLFKDVDCLHISGVTAGLTHAWQENIKKLILLAKNQGISISFDVNYRTKLWSQVECGAFLKEILPYVDYLSAGKLDAIHLLNISLESTETTDDLVFYYQEIAERYPNVKVLYATERTVTSASSNRLRGYIFTKGQIYKSVQHTIEPIVDRIGGGDAFAGGILHGLFNEWEPQKTVEFATAASALKHTIYGDYNQFTEQEVIDFATSSSGMIKR